MKFSERIPEERRGLYRILSSFLGGIIIGLLLGLFLYPRLYPSDLELPTGATVLDTIVIAREGGEVDRQAGDTSTSTEGETSDLPDSDTISPPVSMGDDRALPGRGGATSGRRLTIPVKGVSRTELYDSYDDGRSGGRAHNAIDIPAPEGTPVLAAIDGEVLRLFNSDLGGITLYERGVDGRIYYYAHLSRYARGIAEGDPLRAGSVIAYVGNTGNAGPDNYHLHFAIWIPESSDSYWDGTPVNPYPLLAR